MALPAAAFAVGRIANVARKVFGRGGGGVSLPSGVDVHLEVEGWERFLSKLDAVARSQAPAACANALNSSATRVVARTQKHLAKAESKTRKQMRKIVYKGFRARAPLNLAAQVKVRLPKPKQYRALGKPFTARMPNGRIGQYGRVLSGTSMRGKPSKGWTDGRPRTSSRNLPIARWAKRTNEKLDRRRLTLERSGRVVMREYYPRELVKQLNRRIAKLKARR